MAKVYSLPDHNEIVVEYNSLNPKTWDELDASYKRMDKLMEDCKKDPFALYGNYMDAPDKDGVIGSIIHFGVADGRASYLVMRKKPLTLCYIPCPDGYQADECTLRGVNWTYVKSRAKRKSFAELCAGR